MSADTTLAAQPPNRGQAQAFTYDAFLSYSHQDEAVAAGIQKGLHRIGRRVGQLNALRVFRDSTDLAANPDLWGKVTDAMDRSRYLVVVLSPHAAKSEWVDKEVGYWLEHRGPDQLLIVVAQGYLDWDGATGRFDPDRSDVALPVLKEPGVLPTEPLYVDVSGDAPWDPQAPTFRDKVTGLAAPIHGKSKYELASDDVREQRRFRRLRRAAIAALAILTVAAVTAALVAFAKQHEATQQRQRAERERDQAVALKLTSQAESMFAAAQPGGEVRGLQQLLAAYALSPLLVRGALLDAAAARRHLIRAVGTTERVDRMAFSPDGQRAVTGSADGTVRLWDANTGQPVGQPMTGHTKRVTLLAFSADGKRIASGSFDDTVRVWNVATGQEIGQPIHQDYVAYGSVALSPDGQLIISCSGLSPHELRLWDANTGKPLSRQLTGDTDKVSSVAFSPDGRRVVSGGEDNRVRLWDVATGQKLGAPLTGHTGKVLSVVFSPDGSHIASGSDDKTIRVWDVRTGQEVRNAITTESGVWDVAFSPDGGRVVAVNGDRVGLWDTVTGQPIGEPITVPGLVSVGFSFDWRRILSGNKDGTVRLLDTTVGQLMTGDADTVRLLAFSADGKHMISVSTTVRVWDVATGQQAGHPIDAAILGGVAFSADGQRIITVDFLGSVRQWDAASGQPIGPSPIPKISGGGVAAFSPDRKRIVSDDPYGRVQVWDIGTGQPITPPMSGHTGPVSSVAFSPDGKRVVSGGWDKTVRVWDIATGKPISTPMAGHTGKVNSVMFSADGSHVVSGSDDDTVRVWDAATGKQVGPPMTGPGGEVHDVALSSNGKYIVSADGDGGTLVWDATLGKQIGQPMGGDAHGLQTAVAFSGDGRRIVSGDSDGTLWLWPGPAGWRDELCAKLTTNMSHKQWRDWVSPDIDYIKVCPDLPVAPD